MEDFKCKKCGHKLTKDGKSYGTNWVFFTCINGGCGEGFWIDVKNRVDNNGDKYGTKI